VVLFSLSEDGQTYIERQRAAPEPGAWDGDFLVRFGRVCG
jgi:hypothetical protein